MPLLFFFSLHVRYHTQIFPSSLNSPSISIFGGDFDFSPMSVCGIGLNLSVDCAEPRCSSISLICAPSSAPIPRPLRKIRFRFRMRSVIEVKVSDSDGLRCLLLLAGDDVHICWALVRSIKGM